MASSDAGGSYAYSGPPVDPGVEELRQESFGTLIKDLSADTSHLVKQEINLARAELTIKAKEAGKGVGMLAGAGVAALILLGALTAFLIIVLDLFLPLWVAALIVTLLWAIIAGVLYTQGKAALKDLNPVPEQTIDSVKEDVEWAKHPTRSART